MSFYENLLKARHHIIFLLGLACASGIVVYIEKLQLADAEFRASLLEVEPTEGLALPVRGKLDDESREWAEIAWQYFENNTNPDTGMVNSVNAYPAATMWDTASYMMGLIAAERLGIIDTENFDNRVTKLLASLASMELFEDKLPNKSYNTFTMAMVDYENNATEDGIGWSAIDVGRVLVPLNILVWNYPEHTAAVTAVVERWDLEAMIQDGVMIGAAVNAEGETDYVQEGRIGYEEYAAKTLSIMGFDVSRALRYVDFLEYEDIYDIEIPVDLRDPEVYEAHNYVVSESYVLDGLEFGWDRISKEFAYRVYLAQEARFEETGILTAVSEDNIDEAPYFVYNTVFTSGKAWNAITEDGDDASNWRSLSTKAAFGWHALYDNEYTAKLMEKASELHDPEMGFYSGWYEVMGRPNKALTANTNGIVLESLAYRELGPLLSIHKPLLEAELESPFETAQVPEVPASETAAPAEQVAAEQVMADAPPVEELAADVAPAEELEAAVAADTTEI
ncbi:MAG: DUF3131 domain-containing protein [Pseudomonadota bacterium]